MFIFLEQVNDKYILHVGNRTHETVYSEEVRIILCNKKIEFDNGTYVSLEAMTPDEYNKIVSEFPEVFC